MLTGLHATFLVDHGELLRDLGCRVTAARRLAMTALLVVAGGRGVALKEAVGFSERLAEPRLAVLND